MKRTHSVRGIRLAHHKNTKWSQTVVLEQPDFVVLPMSQHIGVSCTPVVAVGDTVCLGQVIGKSPSAMSAPVHASVSGKVTQVRELLLPNGYVSPAVVIENDHLDTLDPAIQKPQLTDADSFIAMVQASGLVGLGGAGFPTHMKFRYQDMERIHDLIINAAECEPYITGDFRQVMENGEKIIRGITATLDFLNIDRATVVFEKTSGEAADALKKLAAHDSRIGISVLGSNYPKGAEKVTIFSALGRVVPAGALPADVGVIVLNITTVSKIADTLETGIPLVSRRITVDGDGVGKPGNYSVRIGTPIAWIAKACEITDACNKILYGGPMTGSCVASLDQPVMKNTGSLLFLACEPAKAPTPCIHCSRCVQACPMNLMPTALEKAYDRRDKQALLKLQVGLCINCGSCSYVCPAHRLLAAKNTLAKGFIR